MSGVVRRHNFFRDGSVQVRAPVGNHPVAALRIVATVLPAPLTAIPNNRVIRRPVGRWALDHKGEQRIPDLEPRDSVERISFEDQAAPESGQGTGASIASRSLARCPTKTWRKEV